MPLDKFHHPVLLVIGPSPLGSMPPPGSIGSVLISTTLPGAAASGYSAIPMSGAPTT